MKGSFLRKYGSRSFIFTLLGIIIFSCSGKEDETRFDKDVYKPEYSKNFKIEGLENSDNVLITVMNPWQGSENVSNKLLISRDSIVPEGFTGQVLLGNAQNIICMSSTHIAMLDALDAIHKVSGVSGKQYVSNPKILASSKMIPDIGYEGNINYEVLLVTKPDLVLLFSVNGASSMEPKLKELGIPYLYIGDYVEEDPLGKSEWIVPIAEIIGKREKGIEIFNDLANRYNQLKETVSELNQPQPKVMVNAPFADAWFMPSTESYVAKMIKDAGGDYIYKKNTGNSSRPIDIEEALKLVSEADYWINISSVNSMEELKKTLPKFSSAECIQKDNVYNNNLRATEGGGNDCYESGVINPDLILRDLIKIFHPSLIDEDFTYYKRIE